MDAQITPLSLTAAIHIGASSISFLVTNEEGQQVEYLEKSTSLAHDIFRHGEISRDTIEQCVSILDGYISVLSELTIATDSDQLRIVASNILYEASNKDIFINRIQVACGINVELLDDGEMTRLIYMMTSRCLSERPELKEKNTLFVHVGPGNTRLLLFSKGKIESYASYRRGTHRIAESMRSHYDDAQDSQPSQQFLLESIHGQLDSLIEEFSPYSIDDIVCIGSEIQHIARFIKAFKKSSGTLKALEKQINKLSEMSLDDIVSDYNLNYHTAEVILPAVAINYSIAKVLGLTEILVPHSDYDTDLLEKIHQSHVSSTSFTEEVTSSAWALAKRCKVNKKHAKQVTRLSLHLYDSLQDLHKLEPQHRLLLHCAALLHECGGFISSIAHHKHSQYIILHSDIFGLSENDIKLIALIARYHRNSPPKQSHSLYSDLDTSQQMIVSKLASLLRIADALDRTHSNRIQDLSISTTSKQLIIQLDGITDAAVERSAMRSKATLFQNIFGLDIIIQEDK